MGRRDGVRVRSCSDATAGCWDGGMIDIVAGLRRGAVTGRHDVTARKWNDGTMG